jgi:hypothetical protein
MVGFMSGLDDIAKTQVETGNASESSPLVTIGEYKIYPLEYCSEDEIADLFCKMAARGKPGNPVLQGRSAADLKLLGRAMYRKSNILRLGNVAFHEGKPVAIGCNWDVADGGVWEGSGLEMPASMAAHAVIGKAAFDELASNTGRRIWYCGFYGVVPGHNAGLFSWLGTAGAMMADALGFDDFFVYSLLPSLQGREGMYSRKSTDKEKHWSIRFADIDCSPDVSAELKELDGTCQMGLMSIKHTLSQDYLAGAAKMVKIKSVPELEEPAQEAADNQLAWIKQTQSAGRIAAKL